jgi:hypothetical protein
VGILRSAALLACFSLSIGALACASHDTGGKRPLPRPPDGAKPSAYTPDHPLEPGPGGSASRDVVRVDSGRGYAIEVRDYLVPLDKNVTIDFGGVAVAEVRSGGGEVSIGDAPPQQLGQGSLFTVPDDAAARLIARGEPMTLRVWIYR